MRTCRANDTAGPPARPGARACRLACLALPAAGVLAGAASLAGGAGSPGALGVLLGLAPCLGMCALALFAATRAPRPSLVPARASRPRLAGAQASPEGRIP